MAIRVFHPSPLRYSSAGESWRLCESCTTNYHNGGMHKPNTQLAYLSTMASYGHNLVLHGNIKCRTDFSTTVWNQENRRMWGTIWVFDICWRRLGKWEKQSGDSPTPRRLGAKNDEIFFAHIPHMVLTRNPSSFRHSNRRRSTSTISPHTSFLSIPPLTISLPSYPVLPRVYANEPR